MPIFSADTPDFLVTESYIPRRGNNTVFFGNLKTVTDLAIRSDLVKYIAKNKYGCLNYNEKVKGILSPKR